LIKPICVIPAYRQAGVAQRALHERPPLKHQLLLNSANASSSQPFLKEHTLKFHTGTPAIQQAAVA
jgi:hypothetical protein